MKLSKQTVSEWLLGVIIIIGLALLINPFGILMTSAFNLSLIMIVAVAVISFAVFLWREQPRDEREALYGLRAGHISYFAGGIVLVIAIVTEAIQHRLDRWLAITLGSMVFAKLIVSAWTRRN